jgi:hypothetical protein
MIKKTVVGILKDEGLMKNIFTGIGYFVLSAGIAKILIGHGGVKTWLSTILAVTFIFSLLLLASSFWLLHVIRPIMKITWPEFGIPNIDPGVEKVPYKAMAKRVDIWVYGVLAVLSLQGGWYIVEVFIESTSS